MFTPKRYLVNFLWGGVKTVYKIMITAEKKKVKKKRKSEFVEKGKERSVSLSPT